MGVPPHHRGRGWGRRLLELTVAEAAANGEQMSLEVLQSNRAAIHLYASLGFRPQRQLLGFLCPLGRSGIHPDDGAAVTLERLGICEIAHRMGAISDDPAWQLAPATLVGLVHPWQGWSNGAAAAIARQSEGSVELLALVCDSARRRQGYARHLLASIAGHYGARHGQVRDLRIPPVLPEGTASGFLEAVGFRPTATRQWQMTLEPPVEQ